MNYTIIPFFGCNDIKLGDSLEIIREKLGDPSRTFNQNYNTGDSSVKYVMDAYDKNGVYLLFSPDGNLEAVSFFRPARPTLDGVDILALRMSEAIALLKKMDPALAIDSENAVSARFSLGVSESADAEDGEDSLVANFFFGRAGYYT